MSDWRDRDPDPHRRPAAGCGVDLQLAANEAGDPLSDLHASGEYRAHLARVHCARALRRAARL